jgi:hypothetical protein
MNQERAYNRIMASFATGIRGDLAIADFQGLGDGRSAHMLFEFNPSLGRPTGNEIESYFQKIFEGRILPIMSSCSVKQNAVSIVAHIPRPTRPIEDAADKTKMTPVIAGLMYLDNKLQDYWDVKEEDGKKVLAKTVEENIEQIIAARKNRMFVTQGSKISLASVVESRKLFGVGDTVLAYDRGEAKSFVISEIVKGGFKGKFEGSDKEIAIAAEKTLDLQAMALNKAPNEAAKLKKYYEEAYGDSKYGSELVKDNSKGLGV